MNDRLDHLLNVVSLQRATIRYLIVQQTDKTGGLPDYFRTRNDIAIVQSPTVGLSRSRNIGLAHCHTPYALIADDDVTFVPAGIIKLLDIIAQDKPDLALFKIQTPKGELEYKSYPTNSYVITDLKHWLSSIEILVRADLLRTQQIQFDERSGLGTRGGRGVYSRLDTW